MTKTDASSLTLTIKNDGLHECHEFTICGTEGSRSYDRLLALVKLFREFANATEDAGDE